MRSNAMGCIAGNLLSTTKWGCLKFRSQPPDSVLQTSPCKFQQSERALHRPCPGHSGKKKGGECCLTQRRRAIDSAELPDQQGKRCPPPSPS